MDTYLKDKTFHWLDIKKEKEPESNGDELVSDLIGLLASKRPEPKNITFSDELETVAKILELVSDALAQELISEKEAKKVVKYLMSGVVSRRVSNIFDNLLAQQGKSHWFMATGRKFEREVI
ncbi:MAG TPA: hypothetical protein VK074_11295 [Fodinibius sp.]|nr:hypothetical protein [Fodinibius sp.]